jgi:GNAT superfamily N-acetyltransferase
MPQIELPLTWEQFHLLPRNAAYKYEYFNGQAWLSPRPKHFHGLLDLASLAGASPIPPPLVGTGGGLSGEPTRIRPARDADFPSLEPVFAAAFQRMQPFGSLSDARLAEAAHRCLERTRTGGDGPWIEQASFLAVASPPKRGRQAAEEHPVGAILITLLPEGDPCDWDSYYWPETPPPDCIERRLGRPHLTWIFVAPLYTRNGVGTALLAAAGQELRQLGFTHLLSTFLLGNDSSMLWHWRAGFQLLSYPGSLRRQLNLGGTEDTDQKTIRKRAEKKKKGKEGKQ